ncbi:MULTISPECIES: hypothetical protein [unclassified Bradyrhizobium]|uniref:hypothetical protein n=1 Tax=unclassified Bradyrhizobium TaxID=2631580 RepID=UPI0033980D3A
MQISIGIEDLKSALSIDDEAARRKIEKTYRVRRIDDNTLIEPKRQKDGFRITVEAPSSGLLFIDLIDEHGAPIDTLAYDLKAGKFCQPVRDPEPAASAQAKPQADPGRDLELALQIGSKAALIVFLDHHPEGLYADLAKAKLKEMP